jgi:CHAD domain-containing protein
VAKEVSETASAGESEDHHEVEWQFDAVDVRPVERWLRARSGDGQPSPAAGPPSGSRPAGDAGLQIVEAGTVTQVDTYADTPDWRVHRSGYSLRLRKKRSVSEATLKSFGATFEGLRRRREVTQNVSNGDLADLQRSEGPVGERIRAIAGPTSLAPLFEVRTRRRSFDLTLDGAVAGEVAVDETTIPLGEGNPPARLKRVEVEVAEPFVEPLSAFVQAMSDECALHPATLSKYEAGLLSRGLQPERPPDLGSTAIEPSLSVGEVAFAVMRQHFEVFLAREPGTRLGEDLEDLHDMRVASRRLRAAIALFREALPVRTIRLREELNWVAQALGAVRDLDVQLEQLEAWSDGDLDPEPHALKPLHDLLEEERVEARGALLKALDSARHARLVDGFTRLLRQGPLRRSPASGAAIATVAPELLQRRYRAVRKAGDRIGEGATPAEYHKLRIRGKRLRYALEFLSEVTPYDTDPLVKRLVALQDLLGMQQDADVATSRLRDLATREGGVLPVPTVFAMGAVAERYAQRGRELRAQFPKAYRRVRGKRWKELRAVGKMPPAAQTGLRAVP